jgi:hypothetical protein
MSESLLDAAAKPRPADIPEKFWDADAGEIRVEALLKSYRELERRMSSRMGPPGADAAPEDHQRWREMLGIPETPDAYEVTPKHELVGPDPAVNKLLHEAGFNRAQVQLVYDLAAERLLPLIAEAAQQFEADRQLDALRAHFGGEERFRRMAAQLKAWGSANLPAAVVEALSTTSEGVLALERTMQGEEPRMGRETGATAALDESELRKMMRDPRYWRAREPELVKRVSEGFRKLVGG